ncbi:hypothetical protein SAMN05216338_102741 [Bradyrhizobium sp. Rc2d]|uniref:hypothetical protein n=1 Tax=Bradyrhizobium sp. Rc2d TaxID=1855321 RepID=UPI00089229D5|nr:hypothetical protein [Bradyrhizobium sp. Rc2d]SDI65480.1 hypothetical protein SAMN05216338_102741 [Bradyrhizobium sp. Rc2d]
MPSDAELAALLRAVLNEVCVNVPSSDVVTRRRIAAKLREALRADRYSLEELKQDGRDALVGVPTMWR